MTKQDILDHFKDINAMYNESTRYDDLSRMLDELANTLIRGIDDKTLYPRVLPYEEYMIKKTNLGSKYGSGSDINS